MSCIRARVALFVCALVSFHLGSESQADAQDRSATAQMVKLNRNALRAHKARRHDAARSLLLDAEMIAETNGLMSSDIAARTYLHLGLVHLNGFQQKERAVRYFAQALQIRPKITLTRSLANRHVRLVLREAQRRQKQLAGDRAPSPASGDEEASTGKDKEPALARDRSPPPPRPTPAPAEATSVVALDCPVPGEAPAAQELKVQCRFRPGVRSDRAYLFYRADGQPEYAAIRMDREGNDGYTAAIPASIVNGRSLELYVEMETAGGQVTGTVGAEARPKVVALLEGAPPVSPESPTKKESEPLATLEQEEAIADELRDAPEQPAQRGRPPGLRRAPGTWFLGVGGGTALGAHLTRPLEHHPGKRVASGLSFGGVHLVPELGFQYSERMAFSIQGRHQYIPPTDGADTMTIGKPPTTAHAVLARLYYEIWARERLQLLTTATVGGGSGFRLKIPPVLKSGLPSSDTIAGGPLVLGPGVTLFLNLSDSLLLASELRVLAGFNNVAAVVEGSVGVQYGF